MAQTHILSFKVYACIPSRCMHVYPAGGEWQFPGLWNIIQQVRTLVGTVSNAPIKAITACVNKWRKKKTVLIS